MAAPKDPFYAELGKRIKTLRNARKLTQEQLALALQLTRTSITNIEAGKQPVAAHQLVALSRVLNVSADQLLAAPEAAPQPELDERLRDLPLNDAKRAWVTRIVKNPNS